MKSFATSFVLGISLSVGSISTASAGFVQEFVATGEDVRCLQTTSVPPAAVLCSSFFSGTTSAGAFVPLAAGTVVASFYEFDGTSNSDSFFFQQNGALVMNPTFPLGYDAASTLLSGVTVFASNSPIGVPNPISALTIFKNGPTYQESVSFLDGTSLRRTTYFGGSTCGNGFGGPVLMGSSSICLVTERNNALINISYATIARRATQVPIPGTLMLLLIGFGAVAFQMRRRTN
jgi:hypothetical protein